MMSLYQTPPSTTLSFDELTQQNLTQRFLTSGLSQRVFCEQNSLKPSTFKNWVYRYQKSFRTVEATNTLDDANFSATMTATPSSLFVPIHVRHDDLSPTHKEETSPESTLSPTVFISSSPSPASLPLSPPPIRLETGTFSITIPVGFDEDTLRSILSIVGSLS